MNTFLANIFMTCSRFLATDFPEGHKFYWVNAFTSAIETVIAPALGVVASAGLIYAIVLAVQMAKADSADKREEAKKRVVGVVIAVVVLVFLAVFFVVAFPEIIKALGSYDGAVK